MISFARLAQLLDAARKCFPTHVELSAYTHRDGELLVLAPGGLRGEDLLEVGRIDLDLWTFRDTRDARARVCIPRASLAAGVKLRALKAPEAPTA